MGIPVKKSFNFILLKKSSKFFLDFELFEFAFNLIQLRPKSRK